jgi:hypothetical protein
LSSFTVKETWAFAGKGVGHAGNGQVEAGQQRIRILRVQSRCVGGHHVRTQDGGIERRLALRDMAIGALAVVRLESARRGWPPVAKLTSSWQAPQAARVGSVMKALACAAPVVWLWQTSQRRGSAGSITVEKLLKLPP